MVPGPELVICFLRNNIFAAATVIQIGIMEVELRLEEDGQLLGKNYWQFRNIILRIVDFNR